MKNPILLLFFILIINTGCSDEDNVTIANDPVVETTPSPHDGTWKISISENPGDSLTFSIDVEYNLIFKENDVSGTMKVAYFRPSDSLNNFTSSTEIKGTYNETEINLPSSKFSYEGTWETKDVNFIGASTIIAGFATYKYLNTKLTKISSASLLFN